MKMILAIVQEADVQPLLDKLMANGLRATKIASTGGFLHAGNYTVLMGADDDQVAGIVDIIRSVCHRRKMFVSTLPFALSRPDGALMVPPVEVEVGGAHIFIWKVACAGRY